MKFFGITPNSQGGYKLKHIHMPDDLEESISDDVRKEIVDFKKREPRPFQPGYKRDSDEMLQLSPFSLPKRLIEDTKQWQSCEGLPPEELVPEKVKAIACIELDASSETGSSVIAFKVLDRSKVLDSSRRVLEWDETTYVQKNKSRLVVPDGLEAVYGEGTLLFNSYQRTNSFLDLTQFFEEASDEHIDELLDTGLLAYVGEDPVYDVANQTCRRLMSMVNQVRDDLEKIPMDTIKEKARELSFPLDTQGSGDDEVITISGTSKEMKQTLEFLLQRYYPGIFDGYLRRANSAEIIQQE